MLSGRLTYGHPMARSISVVALMGVALAVSVTACSGLA